MGDFLDDDVNESRDGQPEPWLDLVEGKIIDDEILSVDECAKLMLLLREFEDRCEQAERERGELRAAIKRMVDHHVYFFRTESDEVFTDEEKLAAVVFVAGHTVESYQRLIGEGE